MNKKKNDLFERYKDILDDEESTSCMNCGGHAELQKVKLEEYEGGKLYVMEDVPAYVCQECGETWVPEPILIEFEKMITTAKQRNKKSAKKKAPRQARGKRRKK